MHGMERFIQAQVLLLIVTVLAVFSVSNLYLCVLLAGMLMIIFTVRSLEERQSRPLFWLQMLLSLVFAGIAGNPFACLIGYECRIARSKIPQLFTPPIFLGVLQLLLQMQSLPEALRDMLILLGISGLLCVLEQLTVNYLMTRHQITQAISVTAVNEMYEKKLNQELTLKNYLADKNARLEERENISRNIHNSVGHSITAAIMTLDAADMLFDSAPDKAREKMNIANERIRTSLASIRHAVRVLDNENEFVGIGDFISQLTAVTDSFMMGTMIQVHINTSEVQRNLQLPHEQAEFLTGAVQELLSNGVRHGGADRFTVMLAADSAHIRLRIADNGKSDFSAANEQERIQNGYGLKKLIAYIKHRGGLIVFEHENGFRAELMLPLLESDLRAE